MNGTDRAAVDPSAAAPAASLSSTLATLALFAAWPVVNFANDNRGQLSHADVPFLLRAFGVTAAVLLVGLALATAAIGARHRVRVVGVLVALTVLFFNYHLVHAGLVEAFSAIGIPRGENYAYVAVVAAAAVGAWFAFRGTAAARALLVAALILVALPAAGLVLHLVQGGSNLQSAPADAPAASAAKERPRITPNIYYLLTDGYARPDQLKARLGYDASGFVADLRTRGFYIAEAAYANYPMTYLSLPSAFAMAYMVTEASSPPTDRTAFYSTIQGRNPVVAKLRSFGYGYAHMASGVWDGSRCGGVEDLCLASSEEVVAAFYRMTPLSRLRRAGAATTPKAVEQALGRIPNDRPTFLFAHIFAPHPPRTFEGDCTLRTSRGESLVFWKASGKDDYLRDVACTSRELVSLIDRVIARDPDAIIVLHSDHGSAFGVDWNVTNDRWSRDAFEERFAILMALRLPATCRDLPYPQLSPVNVFRLLFACIEQKPMQKLPDESFIAAYERYGDRGPVVRYPR